MTKTLRVDLADLEGIPHASGPSGTSVVVTAEYTSPVILESDGKIILSPKSKTMGASGRVDFDGIYASDSEDVREDHRGFAVRVKVAIREPNGATRTWSRTVKPLEFMADTVRLGRLPSAEGLPPQWVSVDDFVNAVDAQLGVAAASAVQAAADADEAVTLAQQAQAAALEVPDANVAALLYNPVTETRAVGDTIYAEHGVSLAPQPFTDVRHAPSSSGDPSPREYFDGRLWATNASNLRYSEDDGQTWTTKVTGGPNPAVRVFKTSDGEILWVGSQTIHKSSGWSGSPTFTKVYDVPGSPSNSIVGWNVDGDGTKFIVGEYGPDRPESRRVAISLDAGNTWATVWDTAVQFPSTHADSHLHGVAYDPWADRFWLIEGHGEPCGVYYSDNNGTTWTAVPAPDFLPAGYTNDWSPTTIVATDAGMVLATDSRENGLLSIKRTTDPADMRVEWIVRYQSAGVPLTMFGERGFRDPKTGIVYIGFSTRSTTEPAMVMASDGHTGSIVYAHEIGALGDRIRNIVVTPHGTAHMHLALQSGNLSSKAKLGPRGAPVPPPDTGAIMGGHLSEDDRTGTAVGAGSVAAYRGTAIGRGASTTGSQSTAIGWSATVGGSFSIAIGSGVTVAAASATAIGANATTTANFGTAIGRDASAVQGVSLGRQATSAGSGVAIGAQSNAHNLSVALGQATATTFASQVAIGPRHMEMSSIGSEPAAPDAGNVRFFTRTVEGKLQLCARFPSGGAAGVIVLATEP